MVGGVELASVVSSALTILVGDVELIAGSGASNCVDSGMKMSGVVLLASLFSAGVVDLKSFGSSSGGDVAGGDVDRGAGWGVLVLETRSTTEA